MIRIDMFFILLILFHCIDITILSNLFPRIRDIRLDHHDVDTHPDLVVEKGIFSWSIDKEYDQKSGYLLRGIHQIGYQLTIVQKTSFYSPRIINYLFYDSGRVLSNISTNVNYDGPSFLSDSRYEYTLQYWSSTGTISELFRGYFRTPLFNLQEEFQGNWIGSRLINMNELRYEFHIPKDILSGTIFMSGMGYGILFVNGINVDPSRRLDPGWTTYTQRVLYVSYDVTQLLKNSSMNCIGVQLGLGFYTNEQWGGGIPTPSSQIFGPPPRLILQLNVLFNDYTTMNITTDQTWMGREGPHRKDSIYMGTFYDTRAQRFNWSQPFFIDPYSLWLNASLIESPLISSSVQLTYQSMDPIRLSPNALHISTSASQTGYQLMPQGVQGGNILNGGVFNATPIPNQLVPTYDLSQNIAGYCTLTITGKQGMTVSTRHAELLNKQGIDGINYQGLNSANYQIISASDDFIISGEENEVLSPIFTYHGFRYISIYANYINIQSVVCSALHSETTLIGNFTSSSIVLNQIQHNILWSQLSNIMSIIADCSQRQERRAWLGDASLSVDVALFNFDLYGLYSNTLRNIADIQSKDGSIPDTAPFSVGNFASDPSWGHAYPEITWRLYQHYNDTSIIKEHFNGITLWIDYLTSRAEESGLGNMYFYYGDWETPTNYPITNSSLVTSYSYLNDVQIMITLSQIIENQTSIDKYTNLYNQLTKEFHQTFYNPQINGYGEGYQTANALALKLTNVVPSNLRQSVIKSLVDNIISNDNHSTTGIIGTSVLYPLLSECGYHDLAVTLSTQITYPSFGFMFNNNVQNATTIWETYDALLKGLGATASLNHHMFNSIGSWFYRYIGGIQLNSFNEDLSIHPRLTKQLTKIEVELHTIIGSIILSYQLHLDNNTVLYQINIPSSISSIITFEPIQDGMNCLLIEENDRFIWNSSLLFSSIEKIEGILWIEPHLTIRGAINLKIQSGSYRWKIQWK